MMKKVFIIVATIVALCFSATVSIAGPGGCPLV